MQVPPHFVTDPIAKAQTPHKSSSHHYPLLSPGRAPPAGSQPYLTEPCATGNRATSWTLTWTMVCWGNSPAQSTVSPERQHSSLGSLEGNSNPPLGNPPAVWSFTRTFVQNSNITSQNSSVQALEKVTRTPTLRKTHMNSMTTLAYPKRASMPPETAGATLARTHLTTSRELKLKQLPLNPRVSNPYTPSLTRGEDRLKTDP